ncbi:MAG: hypothetical protein ACR2H5_02355, partial [Ktedonobacteraceae bacterium]
VVLDEVLSDVECFALAQMPEAALVPDFCLYSPPNLEYEAQARELLERCEAQPTTKNRYISSILRTKFESSRRHPGTKGTHGEA